MMEKVYALVSQHPFAARLSVGVVRLAKPEKYRAAVSAIKRYVPDCDPARRRALVRDVLSTQMSGRFLYFSA